MCGAGDIWELAVLSTQSFCEPDAALKKSCLFCSCFFFFPHSCSVAGLPPATCGYKAFENRPAQTEMCCKYKVQTRF